MSYILDALKKLEQKRQQDGAPNLLTLPGGITRVSKKKVRWPYVVSSVIFFSIVVLVALLWFGSWKNVPQSISPQAQVTRDITTPSQPATLSTKKEELIPELKNDVISPPEKKEPPQNASKKTPLPPTTKSTPGTVTQTTLPSQPSLPIKAADEPTLKITKQIQPSKNVVTINDLPAEIKSKLTDLKMTVHSYNEHPQSRFAVINNNTVREGQPINGELKLEQITRTGVVLNYQGYRFSLGINENP